MSNSAPLDWADLLRVTVHGGAVTTLPPDSDTGWRLLPYAMVTAPVRVDGRPFRPIDALVGDETVRYGEGDVLVLPPHTRHRIVTRENPLVSVWAHIHLTADPDVDVLSFFTVPKVFAGDAARRLVDAVRDLVTADASRPAGACRVRRAGFEVFEILLAKAEPEAPFARFDREYRDFVPMLAYLRAQGGRRVGLEELATWRHVSLSKLQKDFRRVFGLPLGAYLLRERLDRAARLLAEDKHGNDRIARETGFSDAFVFGKAFKRRYGLPPGEYRLRAREASRT